MATNVDIISIRKRLGRHIWDVPREFGDDGWAMDIRADAAPRDKNNLPVAARIIVSYGPEGMVDPDYDGQDPNWLHASMSRSDQPPTYNDMKRLHAAVWPTGWAYSVWAPPDDHVNYHETALHIWGRLDGRKCLPNFGAMGMI